MENKNFRRFYSQHGEDYLLWEFFNYKEKGFFIEIGAFDGIYLSNTYSFEEFGWDGVCIEPSPTVYKECLKNRKTVCFNVALGSQEQEGKEIILKEDSTGLFSSCNDVIETEDFIKDCYKKYNITYENLKSTKVLIRSLNSLLVEHNLIDKEIDFISIDVEGFELDVLNGIDFSIIRPKVLIIEANNEIMKDKIIEILEKQKYFFAREISVNLIFVSNSKDVDKIKNISINCILEKQIHPYGNNLSIKDRIEGIAIWNGEMVFPKTENFIYHQCIGRNKIIHQELEAKEKVIQELLKIKNSVETNFYVRILKKLGLIK